MFQRRLVENFIIILKNEVDVHEKIILPYDGAILPISAKRMQFLNI